LRNDGGRADPNGPSGVQSVLVEAQPASPPITRQLAVLRRGASAAGPEIERLMFRVLDAETGDGLPNSKIHLAYFYVGGRGEGHELVTDQSGNAVVPEPFEPNDQGMNLFVTAEGHVPKTSAHQGTEQQFVPAAVSRDR
jgi:hypothetical protein